MATLDPLDELPKGGGREVAEHGARTARLHRGEELALERKIGMAHGVNTLVYAVQPAVLGARKYRPLGEPASSKLLNR
jgi:hypothetical protein